MDGEIIGPARQSNILFHPVTISPASWARKFDEQGTVLQNLSVYFVFLAGSVPSITSVYDIHVLLNYSVMNSYAGCESQQGRQRLVFIQASFL